MSSDRVLEDSLISNLVRRNITMVIATYSGSGDEGYIDSINCTYAGKALNEPIPNELKQAAEDLVHAYIEENHGGWENNDGGSGEVRIDVLARTIENDHEEYYTESNSYSDNRAFGENAQVDSSEMPPLSDIPTCTCESLVDGHNPSCPYIKYLRKKGL